ncbi:MAG: MATE family efflux transporter [Phycisphaerae bacterium]
MSKSQSSIDIDPAEGALGPGPIGPGRVVKPALLEMPLARQVAVLAIWPFLEQLLNFMVGFVDTALAGRLSTQATNAIGVAAYIGWLMGLVQAAVGVGATALISRAVGAGRSRRADRVLGQAMLLAPLVGIAVGAGIYVLAPWIGSFVRLTGASLEALVTYLRILAMAVPMWAVLSIGSACLRGAGDTRTPFVVLVVVNIVNVTVSLLLVAGPGPIGGHGIAGIAWGTFVAWIVGGAGFLIVLIRSGRPIQLRRRMLRPTGSILWRILRLAGPNLAEGFLGMWLANFVLVRIVGLLGVDSAWAAHIVVVRIEAVSYMSGFALGLAAATLAGQHLGSGRSDRARQAVGACWLAGAGVMTFFGLIFILLPGPLVRLVTDEPALLAASPPLLRLIGVVQFFFGSAIVLGHGMRGAGDTRGPLLLTAFSSYFVRLPLAWWFGLKLGWGLWGIWLAMSVELTVRGSIFIARYLRGRWLTVDV